MKSQRTLPRLRASVLAIQGALGLLGAARADTDPALLEQTQPKSVVELGIVGASAGSAKANEWTGLRNKGPYGVLGFDVHGGDSYDSADATRWRITGSELATDARELTVDIGQQGAYRVRLGYDEMRRNQSDSYRTPYLGVGTNTLTLPTNWLVPVVPRLSTTGLNARGLSPAVTSSNGLVAGVSTAPTPAQLTQAAAVQAADLADFHAVDLFTKRTRVSLAWDQQMAARWTFSAAFSSEHKEGLKALVGHADSPAETSTALPHPINQTDEKLQIGLGYTGEALQWQASYSLSAFTNDVPAVSWTTWSLAGNAASPNVATMSTGAPSNLFQKLLLNGSFELTPSTKLVGHASYARTWQNEDFPTDASSRGTMAANFQLPTASAQALVVNESAGLKLFDRSVRNLGLSAGVQYELRENRTPVNTYVYYDNNTSPSGSSPFQYLFPALTGLGTNVNINNNTPYSRRVVQGNLDADYQIVRGQRVKVGWNTAKTDRYCIGAWVSCADAAESTEHTLRADWTAQLGTEWTARLGLSGARRSVEYSDLAFLARVPMANQTPSTAAAFVGPTGALPPGTSAYYALTTLGLTGYGRSAGLTPVPATSLEAFYFTPAGTLNYNNPLQQVYYGNRNRMVEENGLRRFDQADRDRNKAQLSVTWQASERLTLQGGAEYRQDKYDKSRYGLQKASSSALNLDVSYAPSDDFNVSVFASVEDQRTRIAGNSIQTAVNSTATTVNGVTAISGAGACYSSVATRNANYKIDPCMDWQSNARDRTNTLGASLSRNKLFKGWLDLSGSVVYSDGRSDNDVSGGFYVNNPYAGIAGAATRDIAAYFIPATPLPTNRARSTELRLGATLHHSADQAIRLGYSFRRLKSEDWGYEGMQPGALAVNLPSYESAPNYRVQAVSLVYVITLR